MLYSYEVTAKFAVFLLYKMGVFFELGLVVSFFWDVYVVSIDMSMDTDSTRQYGVYSLKPSVDAGWIIFCIDTLDYCLYLA